ncbi:MAG: hypothetical protein RR313_11680 [Anaerovoracaceae bacterium]
MDFTLKRYKELLLTLKDGGVRFITYNNYCADKEYGGDVQRIILRHDVDLLPYKSLEVAILENSLGIVATYYFRIVPQSYDEEVIRKIASLGHEIGYHYEDLVLTNGDVDKAYAHFKDKLALLRKFYPVSTICMHGSPKSPIDPKELWGKYNYRDLGVIGEPYIDTNWDNVFYLTDTGRRWDGFKVSRRDKIDTHQPAWNKAGLTAHTTNNVISLYRANKLSDFKAIMITTHPQRWTDNKVSWIKEFVMQNIKNTIKMMLK